MVKSLLADITSLVIFLKHIKKQHDVNVIGFYIVKRVRRWDLERYIGEYKDWSDKDKKVKIIERIN